MSRRKPLTCQSRKVCIVIRKNKDIPITLIKEYCDKYFERYAFIEHGCDIDSSTGEVIPVHYHIVGDFYGNKIPFSTRLNTLCEFFGFDNAIGIEIDQYNSLESSIQYLTHKNQEEKTPHQVDEIIHNFDINEFKLLYNSDTGNVITFDLIFVACLEASNLVEVIKKIGISNYRLWRSVIWDIWRSVNDDQQYQKH